MASPDCDIIEKLLQSSGLSCDDLINKLQQYKAAQAAKSAVEDCPRNLSSCSPEEDISIETSDLKSPSDGDGVIPEIQSSSVDCDGDTTTPVEIVKVVLNEIVERTVEECINKGTPHRLCENDDKISVCSSTNEDNTVTEAIEEFSNEKSQSSKQEDDQKTNEQNTLDDENISQRKKTCSNIDEHNYSSLIRSSLDLEQDFSTSSTEDLYKSEDDLRNTIRMQLSSLRNMKKSNTYLPDLQKKRSIFFHNLKKKRKSCDMNLVTSSKSSLVTSEDNHDEKNDASNVSLIELTDETNFRIMEVTGGIDRITPTIEEKPSEPIENEERKFAAITENNNKTEATIENNTLEASSTSEETAKIIESPTKEIRNILTTYRRKMSLNYFDKNSYKLSTSLPENKPNSITVKKNIAETFAQDPGVNKSVKNSENSPFVSDSLDDFLNESAQLKVSYPIPKLGAEEGIKEKSEENPFDAVVQATNSDTIAGRYTTHKGKRKRIKAKTLADMRRQFEKLKSKNKAALISKPQGEDTPSKEDLKEDLHFKPSTPINSLSIIPLHRNSFVLCDNKKIWTSSTLRNKCIANLDSQSPCKTVKGSPVKPTSPSEETQASKKLSLLSCLKENKPCKIRYGPGPLCKKDQLQNFESRNQWITELKTLPKIYLEVVPEINRSIDFRVIHLLPIFNDPLISEERADFALSVLKPKNQTVETARSFKFQVPYKNNQEKMVVRKQYKPAVKQNIVINTPNKINTENVEADVSKVLNDIISYIEVKEIADDLIKDDVIVEEKDNVDLISKRKSRKRKNRLELELLRLNCKVIDVASTLEEVKECAKPFCKMGCVCKSLLCDSVFSDHCQLVECMFGCKCPPATVNNMIATTNSLSAQTVTHLDDKVKKNLAKVEREFTQTLIHTDNDVILVGAGGKKRTRTARVPKKYSDFVEHIDEPSEDLHNSGNIVLKLCTVNLTKLNLNSLIPYCMSHNLYNCYCKGEDISNIRPMLKAKHANKDKIKSGDNSPSTKAKEDKLKFGNNSSFAKVKEAKQVKHKSGDNNFASKVKEDKSTSDDIIFSATAKEDKQQQTNISPSTTRQHQVRVYDDTCARTRQIFSEYINRNKDPKYNAKLHQIYKRESARYQMRFERSLKTCNPLQISSTSKSADEPLLLRKGNKRKQEFAVREDDYQKEFALQRRKRKIKDYETSASNLYHPIFDGEIKVSLKDNQEMLKIIGEENISLEYLRILPWSKVIESFCSGKMCIWSKEKVSSALLCNAAGYFPPKNFIDIRKIQQRSDIIDWILTDRLPPDIPRELMHLIITPRKHHFMISGYCLKKTHRILKSTEDSLSMEFDQVPPKMEFGELSSSVKLELPDDESEHESLVENQLPLLERQEETSYSEENDQPPVLENMVEPPPPPPPETLPSTNSIGPRILHVPRLIKTEALEPEPESEPSFKKIDLETENVNSNFRIRPISLSKLLEPKRCPNVTSDEVNKSITDKDTSLSKPTMEDIEDIPSFTVPKISSVTSISEEPTPAPKSNITIRRAIPDLKLLKSKSPIKPNANLDSLISKPANKEEPPTFTIPKISEVTSLAEVSPKTPTLSPKSKIQIVRPVGNLKSFICTSSLQSITGQDASISKPIVGEYTSSAIPNTSDVDTDSEMPPRPNIKIRYRRGGPGGLNSLISTSRLKTAINEKSVKSDVKKLNTIKVLKPVTDLRRRQLIVTKNFGNKSVMKTVTLSPKSKIEEARRKFNVSIGTASKTPEPASSTAREELQTVNRPKYIRIISDEVISEGDVPPLVLQAKSLEDNPVQTILSKMRPLKPIPAETMNVCKVQSTVNEEKSPTVLDVTPSADLNQTVPTVLSKTRPLKLIPAEAKNVCKIQSDLNEGKSTALVTPSADLKQTVQTVLGKTRPLKLIPAEVKNVCKIQSAVIEGKSTTALNETPTADFNQKVQTVLSKMRPLKPVPALATNVCKIQSTVNEEKSTTALNVTPSDDLNQTVPSTVSTETRKQRLLSISNSVESIASTGEISLVFSLESVELESAEDSTKGKQNITHPKEIKRKESPICEPLGSSSPKTRKVAASQSPVPKSNDEENLNLLEPKTNSSVQLLKTGENLLFNTSSRDSFRSDGSFKYASPAASDFGSDADFSFDIDEEILNQLDEPSESSNTVEETREQTQQLSFPSPVRIETSESSNSNKAKLDTTPPLIADDEAADDPSAVKETNREKQPVFSSRRLSAPTEVQRLSNNSAKSIEEPSESIQVVEEVQQAAPISAQVIAEASTSKSHSAKTQPQSAADEPENCPILFKETSREGQPVLTVVLNHRKPPNLNEAKIVSGRKMKCTHRDMENNSKTMILYTKTYFTRNLCFFDDHSRMKKLAARLPKVKRTCRWRMIYLNSDFTFLKFTKSNYSIKYTDLMDVVKMANNTNLTMLLKNPQFSGCYEHLNFGIYCICDYTDRLFIGPFLPEEDHGISTLRYLRGKLIDTEEFNSMVGKKVEKKLPVWLYEMPFKPPRNPNLPPKDVVIDISDEDDDDVCVVTDNTDVSIEPVLESTSAVSSNISHIDDNEPGVEKTEETSIRFPDTFLCPPFVTALTRQEMTQKEVNRYMLTNVPHLGYFEAYQRCDKTIEVFWPDGRRGYRFSTVKLAKSSLVFYLSQFFSTIPKSFKITIVSLTDLDKAMFKPISPTYLLRPKSYICCDLGIYAKECIPKSVWDRFAIPDVLACIDADKDDEETEDKMIRLFGLALMSNTEFKKWSNPNDTIQWAKTEMYILNKLAGNYESEKTDLRNMLRTKSLRIQELQLAAPSVSIPAVSLRASAKTAETIEIDDSDDEDPKSTTNANKSKKSPRKIQGGSTSTLNQTENRSLLKSNFKVKSNLLKMTDSEKEKFNLERKKLLLKKASLSKAN